VAPTREEDLRQRLWSNRGLAAAGGTLGVALLLTLASPCLAGGDVMAFGKAVGSGATKGRSATVLTPGAVQALQREGRATLWVYFADKGEADAASLARAVAEGGDRVGAASRVRRARMTGGRFIADVDDVPVAARYRARVEALGARIRQTSRWLNAVSVEVDEAGARQIAELSFVRRVEPVMHVEVACDPPADYGASLTQNLGINAVAAIDSGYSAAGVVVAILDTGFRKDHAALAPLKRIAEWDFVNSDGETANQAGDDANQWNHGTGIWSILGGYLPVPGGVVGAAFNGSFILAKIHDIRVSMMADEDHWVAAAEWVDSIGVDIVQSSLAANYPYQFLDGRTTPMAQATNVLTRHGALVVCAMGNSGPAAASLWTPADCDSVLAVGSVNESDLISSFSSRGPSFDGRGKPDLVAQGENTVWADAQTPNAIASYPGTSIAAPLVSAAAALVKEAHPDWTCQQIRYALKSTADKASTPDSTTYGWGRPNVLSAIYQSTLGGPVFPKPFSLTMPPSGSVNVGSPVTFSWRTARDLNPGDAVSYAVQLRRVSPEQVVFTSSTSDTFITYGGPLVSNTLYEWKVVATDLGGHGRPCAEPFQFTSAGNVAVGPGPGEMPGPARVLSFGNRPNPFSTSTQIEIRLAGNADGEQMTLRVFDVRGRRVRTLLEGAPGVSASIAWDGRTESGERARAGIYYYRLDLGYTHIMRRLVLLN
jgi:subtilisin family serine protease